ncbi:hypothetical protein [Hymenobacter sp.]|uniref:hypothetical protein n=1 Tax=Hymenobacter sp. TaxID=1898978 RepID=UPI00286D3185|nr:hypothetical protein [Hymenobacter sp.]
MAGERLAQQTIFITSSALLDGDWVEIWLDGGYRRFTALLGSGTTVPAGTVQTFQISTDSNANRPDQQRFTAESFIYALRQWIIARGVTTLYNVEPVIGTGFLAGETVGCVIQVLVYDPFYDFPFPLGSAGGARGISWFVSLTNTIRPVQVAVQQTPAGNFGGASGTITLTASNGTDGVYAYTWADGGPPVAARTGLAAGSYTCVVRDTSGASASVTVVIVEEDRIEVVVVYSGNSVQLVVTGGVGPYAYAWGDGPTTPARVNLPVGTYACTVTDAAGATAQVSFALAPYRFYWSRNAIALALDAGPAYRLNPATKPNLSFLCEVWVEPDYRSGVFVQVGATNEQPADRQGRTTFEVQALLDAYVSEHLPELNQRTISRADSLFKRFYLQYTERFGEPAVTSAAFSTQAQHYVVHGGLDFFEAAAGTWFDSYQGAARPFLTWEPNDKKCLPAQPQYLYFMVDSFDLPAFKQWVRLRYADGSAQEYVHGERSSCLRYEVYCLPAGFAQLGLGAGPARFFDLDLDDAEAPGKLKARSAKVVAWEIYVTDAANVPVSEVRRYVLDTAYVPAGQQRFFLYANSLGGVSTFAALGQAKRTLDLKQEVADRAQPAGYDPLLGDAQVQDKSGQPVLAVSSGQLRRDQLIAAQDLALSRRVVLQRGDRYWPGVLKPKAFPVDDETETLAALEFEFLLPRQRQFSPRLPVTPAGLVIAPVSGGEGAQP